MRLSSAQRRERPQLTNNASIKGSELSTRVKLTSGRRHNSAAWRISGVLEGRPNVTGRAASISALRQVPCVSSASSAGQIPAAIECFAAQLHGLRDGASARTGRQRRVPLLTE